MNESDIKVSVFKARVTEHMLAMWLSWGSVMSSYMENYDEAVGIFNVVKSVAKSFYEAKGEPIPEEVLEKLTKWFHNIRVEEKLSTDSILDWEII